MANQTALAAEVLLTSGAKALLFLATYGPAEAGPSENHNGTRFRMTYFATTGSSICDGAAVER